MSAAIGGQAGIPADITLHIDRMVVETVEPVDASAFQRELAVALRAVVEERGVRDGWGRDVRMLHTVIDGLAWNGRGGLPGLARAVAVGIYEGVLP